MWCQAFIHIVSFTCVILIECPHCALEILWQFVLHNSQCGVHLFQDADDWIPEMSKYIVFTYTVRKYISEISSVHQSEAARSYKCTGVQGSSRISICAMWMKCPMRIFIQFCENILAGRISPSISVLFGFVECLFAEILAVLFVPAEILLEKRNFWKYIVRLWC